MTMSTNKVCAGMAVILTCSAGAANPAIQNYALYEIIGPGLTYITSEQVGVFKLTLDTEGLYHYVCEASNSVGNASSGNKSVEVHGEFNSCWLIFSNNFCLIHFSFLVGKIQDL